MIGLVNEKRKEFSAIFALKKKIDTKQTKKLQFFHDLCGKYLCVFCFCKEEKEHYMRFFIV